MDVLKIIIYLSLNLFLYSSVSAQTPASSSTVDGSSYDIATNSILGLHGYGKVRSLDYDEVDGSPYFNDEFVYCKALHTNGIYNDSLLIKYDLAKHVFIAKLEDDSEISIDARYFREFRLNIEGEEILFKRVDPKQPKVFFEIIYQEKGLTIYKSEEVNMVKGEDLGITKSNDRFFKKVKYYVKKDKEVKRVKLKKEDLWKFFNEDQIEILERHIRHNKIKLKKDKDFRRLLRILNGYV